MMMKLFNITPYQRLIQNFMNKFNFNVIYKYFGYYLQGTIAKYFHFQSFLMFFIKIIFKKKTQEFRNF
jgi:hypothetical protein